MHAYIIASSFESDVMVGSSLIHMYGKHHCIDNAESIFGAMLEKNVVTWNSLITAFIHDNQIDSVLRLFSRMGSEGILPTKITYTLAISICAFARDSTHGVCMHTHIIASGYASDVVVGCALVTFYGKIGDLNNAKEAFDQVLSPNVVVWTALITAYSGNGRIKEAFECYSQMQGKDIAPNEVTFVSLMDVCARQAALQMGIHLHTLILLFGLDLSLGISNVLIHFYGECGHIEECWKIFRGVKVKDIISWNGMITACVCNGQSLQAMKIFLGICESGLRPTKATFMSVFDACTALAMLSEAYNLHLHVLDSGIELDGQVGNALISLYGSCNSLADAQAMFLKMSKSNLVGWNALLGAYVKHERGESALALYYQMIAEGLLPNNFTMISVFSACACHRRLVSEGKHLHACWFAGGRDHDDVAVCNSLLSMYGKSDNAWEVHKCFSYMPLHNTISYNVLMSACTNHYEIKALQHFNDMLSECLIPDVGSFLPVIKACANQGVLTEVSHLHVRVLTQRAYRHNNVLKNALIYAYSRCNTLEIAQNIFDDLVEQCVVAWNSLMAACINKSLSFTFFDQMLHKAVLPNEVTYLTLITSSASQAMITLASQVHARIICSPFFNFVVGTALVYMHGCCGQLESAFITFKAMQMQNLVLWNAILTVCAHHGKGKETLQCLEQMQLEGLSPDEVSFIACLSACGHDGRVVEAFKMLSAIESNYGLQLIDDYYSCIIDALGRAGQLECAEFLLKTMVSQILPAPGMTILSFCEHHRDLERGHRIYNWILDFELITQRKLLEEKNCPTVLCFDDDTSKMPAFLKKCPWVAMTRSSPF
ncbi:hypothetical protein KP509_18G011000 [Ceratopteris richardii]|nr:hypothetical protein KP509_18G011000 [Ceratopteris richardii]